MSKKKPSPTRVTVPTDVRLAYLRDPANPRRVLTIARRLAAQNVIHFAFAANRPPTWVTDYAINVGSRVQKYVDGDQFDKNQARRIALGRLEAYPFKFTLQENGHPLDSLLDALVSGTYEPVHPPRPVAVDEEPLEEKYVLSRDKLKRIARHAREERKKIFDAQPKVQTYKAPELSAEVKA